MTELTTKDGNFLVSLNVSKGEDIDFNIAATVFGKGDDNIVDWFNRGLATYIDKEKALDYFSVSAPLAEAQNNQELISTTEIIQNFQNPKIEAKKSLITPEMDASYLDAVERGKDGKWRYEINDGVFLLCLLLIVVCYDCVTEDDSTVDLIDYGKRNDFSHVFTLFYNVLIYSVLGSM